jgi:hypothetical protein
MTAPNRQATKAAQIERLFRLAPTTGNSLTTNREIMIHHSVRDHYLFYRAGL